MMTKKYSIIIFIIIILLFTIFGLLNLPKLLNKKEQKKEIELVPTLGYQIILPTNTPIPTLTPIISESILAPTLNYIEIPDPTDL